VGIKQAFQRALIKLSLAAEYRRSDGSKFILPEEPYKERYGAFMYSFFNELRVRSAAPPGEGSQTAGAVITGMIDGEHAVKVLDGEVLPPERLRVIHIGSGAHNLGGYPSIPPVDHLIVHTGPKGYLMSSSHGLGAVCE